MKRNFEANFVYLSGDWFLYRYFKLIRHIFMALKILDMYWKLGIFDVFPQFLSKIMTTQMLNFGYANMQF